MDNERCNICNKKYAGIWDKHNASPLNKINENIKVCCSTCNTKYVIKARVYGVNEIKNTLPEQLKEKYGIK